MLSISIHKDRAPFIEKSLASSSQCSLSLLDKLSISEFFLEEVLSTSKSSSDMTPVLALALFSSLTLRHAANRSYTLFSSLWESFVEAIINAANMASRYAERVKLKKMNLYKGEKVKAMKKISLNDENHNYLRSLLVKIPKIYGIELFLIDLAALYLLLLQITLFLEVVVDG